MENVLLNIAYKQYLFIIECILHSILFIINMYLLLRIYITFH